MDTGHQGLLRDRDVSPIGRVATASLLWRTHGRLHLTVVVKATYAFRLRGRMLPRDPRPVNAVDEHFDAEPQRSIQVPTDAVPFLAQADVVLTGHAYPPRNEPRATSAVSIGLTSAEPLVYKTLYIHGERTLLTSGPTPPAPFERMPLVYERTVRGRDGRNPLGRSAEVGQPLPNIIDPDEPERPTGFGALPRSFPPVRTAEAAPAPGAAGVSLLDVPADFDWSGLQAAPPDQRVPYFTGDEWLLLEGLDPEVWRVQTRLPGGAAQAWVWPVGGPGSSGHAVQMNADTLFIDSDAGLCTLSWRGAFAIESVAMLETLHIAAGVRYPDAAIDWPAEIERIEQAAGAPTSSGTLYIDAQGGLELQPRATTDDVPLDQTVALGSPDGVWRAVKPAEQPPAAAEAAVWRAPAKPAAPEAAHNAASPPRAPRPVDPRERTLPVDDGVEHSVAAPFPVAPAAESHAALRPIAVPGAPWSDAAVRPVHPPSGDPNEVTLAVPEPASAAAADGAWRARSASEPPWTDDAPPAPAPAPSPVEADVWRSAAPQPQVAVKGRPVDPYERTLDHTSTAPQSLGAPFPVPAVGSAPSPEEAMDVPGAPWAHAPARRVRLPSGDPFERTLSLDDANVAAAAEPPTSAPGDETAAPLGAAFLAAMAAATGRG